MKRLLKITFAAALLSALAGCGGAPSESEMKTAWDKQVKADMASLRSLPGGGGFANMMPETKLVNKIGCKDDGEKAYRCDVEMEVSQGGNTRKAPINMRFVKVSDGWAVQMQK